MKKLIAMIGAVAMSFGLFATGNAPFAISYEATETEAGVSGGEWTPGTKWSWNGDVIPVITDDARVLPYGAEGTSKARRNDVFLNVTGGTDNDNYADLSTGTDELTLAVDSGNVFLDQLVKFTGFEDPQTNLVAGTKIAIWMSEFENEDESTSTNLYITCGKNVDGTYEQVAFQIEGTYELNTWYRLTVKSLGDIFDGAAGTTARAGFLVWVNGNKAICEDAKLALGGDADLITDSKKTAFYNAGRLFPAFAASDALATVGYQGIGAIDDIIVDDDGPEFCVETIDVSFNEIENAVIAKVVDGDGTVFNYPDGTIAVKPGTLAVTLAAAPGYKLFGETDYEVTATVAGPITIDTTDKTTFEQVVATITRGADTLEFAGSELDTAISQVQDNDVVTFLAEVTFGEGAYTFTKDTTITVTEGGNWAIYVADDETSTYECGYAYALAGVMPEKQITVSFENEETGFIMLGGTIYGDGRVDTLVNVVNGTAITLDGFTVGGTFQAEDGEGAILQAAVVSPAVIDEESQETAKITLAIDGKVITTIELDETAFTLPDGEYKLNIETNDVEGTDWYTYSAAQSGPEPTVDTVTFTVTYDDTKVENVTVTTNSEAVADVEGVYTVKSNAVVTIVATAAAGYQNVTITSEDVTIDNGVFTADVDDATITIDAEEIPAAGFKIIISGIDAADVTEDATTITIATEAQPLVYIGGVAATVGGEAGAWTVTKPEITADTAISIVAATTIPATGHAWYENPTLMGKVTVAYGKDGCGGWNGAKDLAGDYIAAAFGYSGLSAVVTKISDLVAGNGGEVAPIAVYPASEIGGSLRGAGVSTALGVTIFGSAETHEITVISLDGLTTNKVTTSNGVIPDSFWFSDDGQFLYANGYEEVSGDSTAETAIRQNVYKYAIVDNLIGDGEKLVLSETYTVGKRVRGMTKFGDVILARTDDGYYAIDLAATEPAFAKVGAGGKCDDVVIAGGHFYHLSSSTGILSIYNLNTAGTWYEGEAIATYNVANVLGCRVSDTGNNFFVTPDEETLVFCETVAQTPQVVKAFQWTLPTYDITIAKVENGTLETSVTNGIAAGTTVNVYATPLEGYKIASVTTNGAELVGDSFEMPAENVTIAATFALQQFTVADISVENATAVATNTATDTGLDLPATVDYNTAIVVTVTPDTGYEYKSAPAGWTKNDNGSITTNATVTADLAITVEAPTAADPWNPPTKDDEASQKVADLGFSQTAAANITTVAEFTKFENYVKTASGETDPAQLTENQKANAYLAYALNATAIPTEEITSDDVEITSFEGGVIEITIEGITVGSDVSSEMIAKVIDVVGNDELTEMSAENVTTTGRAGVNGKVQVTVAPADDFAESTKFFYRASVKK